MPRPQGSKRYVGNNRFVEASNVKPWRKAIAQAADAVFSGVIDVPVAVSAVFVFPKPKTVDREYPSVMPDADKLARALGDALSVDSTILMDDSRIVSWRIWKVYGDVPGVWVEVTDVIPDTPEGFI
jgi:Holliday junction resolvase RusA-like endonuclease